MNYNNYDTQKLRGLKRKLELVKSRGGKCEICGYDKNIAVLEFHHINPDEKEFQLDMRHLSNTSLERLKKEVNKCQLLCANCHREIHNIHLGIDEIDYYCLYNIDTQLCLLVPISSITCKTEITFTYPFVFCKTSSANHNWEDYTFDKMLGKVTQVGEVGGLLNR